MPEHYHHLGVFSDWVAVAKRQQTLYPAANPGPQTRTLLCEALGFCHGDESPMGVKIESKWEKDGVMGEEISWWVGYGPRTHAYCSSPQMQKSHCLGSLPCMTTVTSNIMEKKTFFLYKFVMKPNGIH